MTEQWDVLVTSSQVEDRKNLIHILNNLSVNVFMTSDLTQAEELLAKRDVALVFCDDDLPDGSYRELLVRPTGQKPRRIVVTTRAGEWEEYLEAMRLGAFDVIRYPLRPTDVELTVLRAMHDQQVASYRMSAA